MSHDDVVNEFQSVPFGSEVTLLIEAQADLKLVSVSFLARNTYNTMFRKSFNASLYLEIVRSFDDSNSSRSRRRI